MLPGEGQQKRGDMKFAVFESAVKMKNQKKWLEEKLAGIGFEDEGREWVQNIRRADSTCGEMWKIRGGEAQG